MKKLICATGVMALMLTLAACSDQRVNRSNYNLLDVGMHYQEVQHMLGEPTWCDDFRRPHECRWGTEERHIEVIFVARRVVATSQQGL